ncbi:MAG: NAD(P)H-dependent oxidoreductase subunit E [Thermodesulfovibrionia bacterium]|nr:NAD(P)H-dependent oxidoreductase subunit E [Thermodesulfovibrionia bacterium]
MTHNGKILIVDDEPDVLKSCENILRHEGYTIDSAGSGPEAIDFLQKNEYDIVFTDIEMPEDSGIEVIRWINNSKPGTGVVAIADNPTQDSIRETLKLGIVDYLPKPFTQPVLIDAAFKAVSFMRERRSYEKSSEEEAMAAKEKEIAAKSDELDKIIANHRDTPGGLIPILQQAQELIGYLPASVQRKIARGINIPVAEVHGVVSFYSFFSMKPKGRHVIKVCLGTACYVKRAEEIMEKLKEALGINVEEITKDNRFSLESVRCLGACGLAPVVVVDHDTHASVNPVKTAEILAAYE